jgi:hypothetical protein
MWMKASVARPVRRSLARTTALGLCAAALLAAGGCSQNGSYRLSWIFVTDKDTGATESTATGCGRFYVDSIVATGTNDSGDAQQLVAPCTPGWVTAEAPPGTWSFTVEMRDPQGILVPSNPPDMMRMMTSPQPIVADGPQAQLSVSLWPAPSS